jgi:hypothetical protein
MTRTVKSTLALASSGMAVLLLVLAFASPVQAVTESERHNYMVSNISEMQTVLESSLEVLKSKHQEEWTPVEIQEYLHSAMWAVDYGIVLYMFDHNRMPDSVESLANTEYVPVWPVNPLNEFTPIEVLEELEGFKPGELVLLICPQEEYSIIGNPRPLSFQIAVYGTDEDFAKFGQAEPLPSNKWAQVPSGALYMTGMHTESAAHLKAKWEKLQAETAEEGNQTEGEN